MNRKVLEPRLKLRPDQMTILAQSVGYSCSVPIVFAWVFTAFLPGCFIIL